MSYSDIAAMAHDAALRDRLIACAAQELTAHTYPTQWVDNYIWKLCGAPDWDEAYAYAVANSNPNPGGDAAVITDGMILSRVQALLSELSE